MDKSFVLAEVKTVDSKEPSGEFEAIISAPTLDRDGEVIDTGAFQKGPGGLPASIPIHAFHDFKDPIGRGTPEYRDDVLHVRGRFASTPRAQEIRSLVAEGVIANMSVGFMAPEREAKDGVTHILAAELLEASFVSVSSNREAAILAVKALNQKPYENEHACRLEDPSQFERFRRDNDKDPNVIIGFRSDGSSTAQAFRYPTATWTEARAKEHCADHDGRFEAAAKQLMSLAEVRALEDLPAAPSGSATKIPAATDPEPAAAPAAAAPADVPVGQVYAAMTRAQAALLTTQ